MVSIQINDVFGLCLQVQKYATLYVNDVNDNAPQFMGQPYKAEIAEVGTISIRFRVYGMYTTKLSSPMLCTVNYSICVVT